MRDERGFDVVVVGSGGAGCEMAARLSTMMAERFPSTYPRPCDR